ncbi:MULTISPECIES: Na(+)/H(+) antiporter subunit C [Lysinibacillus]|uniref:Monovalent cation/H+ antiporter subunit C n=2 Tax=Lysinibacillus TaxID=400634 RepID=R7ZJT5_LYSSH|nr:MULTISPECIES: Na(+)/H(+) antiporter subunit C [Lysinibacillus]EON74360.1 monovalent cation/H+ antiporter subunit C [Lysinibacillus sphaericus OT4b.31]QDP99900.1 Na(+)/H(+) antiporter subunit C [Lysinibacillus fusiformis]
MEIIMAFVIGFLFMAAVYLILSKSLLRIIIGTGLLSHGAHLLILTMGGLGGEAPPVLTEGAKTFADPLPQALILTAIVISFGVTAFFLVLAYRSYQELETDDISLMRGSDEDE